MNKIDNKKLLAVPNASKDAKFICKFLAGERQRDSRVTNLAGFRHLLKSKADYVVKDRAAYDKLWKDLEAAGIGQVKTSPRGIPSHFDWQGWSSRSVAEATLNPKKQPVKATFRANRAVKHHPLDPAQHSGESVSTSRERAEPSQNQRASAMREGGVSADKIFAVFTTQNAEAIKLELNKGLSRKDRDNLLKLVQTLPVRED